MNYNLSNFEFRLTCEDDWEILKAIRLQSLFDSPDASEPNRKATFFVKSIFFKSSI